jgi:hypothetical protein
MTLRAIILLLCAFCGREIHAQQLATTEDGRTVKLNENGTWQYVTINKSPRADSIIHIYSKPQLSTTYVKSSRNKFGFWYDKNVWNLAPKRTNEYAEFELVMPKGDGYAMFISEKIEIDLDHLKKIVIKNAQQEDPDIAVEKEEMRKVNGIKLKFLQMSGEAHGVKFVYQGYYSSNSSGTIQFVCFTPKNLIKDYESIFLNLLNGLVSSSQ